MVTTAGDLPSSRGGWNRHPAGPGLRHPPLRRHFRLLAHQRPGQRVLHLDSDSCRGDHRRIHVLGFVLPVFLLRNVRDPHVSPLGHVGEPHEKVSRDDGRRRPQAAGFRRLYLQFRREQQRICGHEVGPVSVCLRRRGIDGYSPDLQVLRTQHLRYSGVARAGPFLGASGHADGARCRWCLRAATRPPRRQPACCTQAC